MRRRRRREARLVASGPGDLENVPYDRVQRLRNPIRGYAWGSDTALAELTGRAAPTPEPEAELWMGAHPTAPSHVLLDGAEQRLDEWIRQSPEATLGREVAERFGDELPFLFKVIAPARPLSIQAHPNAEQAREGFARENAEGRALADPERSYRDPHHKPELVCALTPFEVMCGFRPIPDILEALAALGLASLEGPLAALRRSPDRAGLKELFGRLMTPAPESRERLAHELAEAAAGRSGDADACACAVALAERYPGDPGVSAPFLLNHLRLAPGEALFLPAGELHAYLEGVAIEAMANSDNVIRGGLTPKHVDVGELLRILTFSSGEPPVLRPREVAPGVSVYDSPAEEFSLAVLEPKAGSPVSFGPAHSAEILLCTEGEAVLVDEGRADRLRLERGAAAFVPAAVSRYRLEGEATVYRTGVSP